MCFPPIIASSVGNKFVSWIKRWGARSVCAVQKRTCLKIAVLEIGLVLKAPYQSGLSLLPAEELDFLKVYFLQQAGEIKTHTHPHTHYTNLPTGLWTINSDQLCLCSTVFFPTIIASSVGNKFVSSLFKEDHQLMLFYNSVLQAVSGGIPMALCLQVVSQAPQHFAFFFLEITKFITLNCLSQCLVTKVACTVFEFDTKSVLFTLSK